MTFLVSLTRAGCKVAIVLETFEYSFHIALYYETHSNPNDVLVRKPGVTHERFSRP
jgi:hypothetical protein